MQAILYGDFWFNSRQCSVKQSGEVKHSLQQSSAVKCIAVWSSAVLSRSLQSSPIYSSQVSSMQVHCSVSPSRTTQVNISQLQQCSVVLSSPVPLTEGFFFSQDRVLLRHQLIFGRTQATTGSPVIRDWISNAGISVEQYWSASWEYDNKEKESSGATALTTWPAKIWW